MGGDEMAVDRAAADNLAKDAAAPLVTAVLVCWNHERFVRQAVLSALGQSYRNMELIVFENGSTDASRSELEGLQRQHGFTLICQDNVGVVGAMNQGLAMARGKYLTPLATDDVWLEDKIQRQVHYLETHPDVHMLAGGMQFIDANGQILERGLKVRSGDKSFSELMRNGCSVYGPTVMLRVETLRRLNGFDTRTKIEDYATALHLTRAGYRVVVLDEIFTQYRRHENNWTSKPIWKERLELGHIFRSAPEYGQYIRHNMKGYFRELSGKSKMAALRLLINEPIEWSWNDVGIGLIKLIAPVALLRVFTRIRGIRHVE